MKRPLLATATLAAVGCSLFLAGPAHAATSTTEPSVSSRAAQAAAAPGRPDFTPVLQDVSYNPTTRVATVNVSNVYSHRRYDVIHKNGDDSASFGIRAVTPHGEGGTWVGTFSNVYRGDVMTLKETTSLDSAIASITIDQGLPVPASRVETTKVGSNVRVDFVHYRPGSAWILDATRTKRVAGTDDSEGRPDGAFVSTFVIPDTGRTSSFIATPMPFDADQDVPFTINEGMTDVTPAAPTVGAVDPAGTRALATVTGEAGATVTVKDSAGKTVAVKILGTSGTAQVIVPASTIRTANAFTVTQTAGGATSAATPFTA